MAKAPTVKLPQARRWHSHVWRWAENVRRDLRADFVAAPKGDGGLLDVLHPEEGGCY